MLVFIPDDGTTIATTGLQAMGSQQMGESGAKTRYYMATSLEAGQSVALTVTGLKSATSGGQPAARPAASQGPTGRPPAVPWKPTLRALDRPQSRPAVGAAGILGVGGLVMLMKAKRRSNQPFKSNTSPARRIAMLAAKETSSAVVRAIGLGKTLDDRPVLKQIDLSIDAGEYVVILGVQRRRQNHAAQDAGDAGTPSGGELRLFGLSLPRQASVARARLGLIGHQSMLYRDLTGSRKPRAIPACTVWPIPANALISCWSRGPARSRRRSGEGFQPGHDTAVSIARALVHEPDLLLADEPFAGLDVPGALAIERLWPICTERARQS